MSDEKAFPQDSFNGGKLSETKAILVDFVQTLLSQTTDLLAMESTTALAQTYLTRIRLAETKLETTLEQVFDQSQWQTGKLDPNMLRHDLGNPLHQIIGYSDMLQEKAKAETHLEWGVKVKQLNDTAHRLLTSLNQIAASDEDDWIR